MQSANDLFNKPLWDNGPQPGNFYNFPGSSNDMNRQSVFNASHNLGKQHSAYPIATGTSVLGIKFDGGVLIAADTLVSYGSLASFRHIDRVFKLSDTCIYGAGNDFADFQYVKKFIDEKAIEDYCYDDTILFKPKSLYTYITRMMYSRRCRVNPLWIELVVGGMQDGEPFLGHIDLRGRSYEDNVIATGFGKHLALPLLREYSENPNVKIDLDTAMDLVRKCMEVLFYRDGRSYPHYKVAVCTKDGVRVEGPLQIQQNWNLANSIKGY